jgi:hypothetical protein
LKYYVSFPIFYDCDLRCYYCFSADSMRTNMPPPRQVTVSHYNAFREKFLADAEEIVVELNGGESFLPMNNAAVLNFIRRTETDKIELQSNGLQPGDMYKSLIPFKERILRLGFTYHRKMIHTVPSFRETYKNNVLMMRDLGFPIYVKEILFPEEREAIRENKAHWESLGVDFKVQDFKGSFLGSSGEQLSEYSPEDYVLLSNEYVRNQSDCRCKKGYKQLLVMRDGSILACYVIPDVVGNMIEGTYSPNYYVSFVSKSVVWT